MLGGAPERPMWGCGVGRLSPGLALFRDSELPRLWATSSMLNVINGGAGSDGPALALPDAFDCTLLATADNGAMLDCQLGFWLGTGPKGVILNLSPGDGTYLEIVPESGD
jgi:hypothetical protein